MDITAKIIVDMTRDLLFGLDSTAGGGSKYAELLSSILPGRLKSEFSLGKAFSDKQYTLSLYCINFHVYSLRKIILWFFLSLYLYSSPQSPMTSNKSFDFAVTYLIDEISSSSNFISKTLELSSL